MSSFRAPFIIALLASIAFRAHASDLDEFKIKRQEIFEFTQKPSIARNGDRVEISFAAKGFCDATIAIETGGAGAGNAGKSSGILSAACSAQTRPHLSQKMRSNKRSSGTARTITATTS